MSADHPDNPRPRGTAGPRALAEESVRLAEETLCGVECTVTILRGRLDRLRPGHPATEALLLTLHALGERIARLHATRTYALQRLARMDARQSRLNGAHDAGAIRPAQAEERWHPTLAPPPTTPSSAPAARADIGKSARPDMVRMTAG